MYRLSLLGGGQGFGLEEATMRKLELVRLFYG